MLTSFHQDLGMGESTSPDCPEKHITACPSGRLLQFSLEFCCSGKKLSVFSHFAASVLIQWLVRFLAPLNILSDVCDQTFMGLVRSRAFK